MFDNGLTEQADIEALTAWLDGELTAPEALRVERAVAEDPRWGAACREFRAVEQALAAIAPAQPRRNLTDAIVAAAFRRRRWTRAAEVLVPLAAAAGIALAVLLSMARGPERGALPGGIEGRIAAVLRDVRPDDRPIVQNLPFFRNYERVVEYQQVRQIVDAETLRALEALEAGGGL